MLFRSDSRTLTLFEATSSGARSTRGQLAMYADHQFKHQPRLFLFQVVVTACHARLLYWDRSGATVTKAFNLFERPEVLVDFLWRFAHATERQRGWDDSTVMASRDERRLFLDAIHTFEKEGGNSIAPTLAAELGKESRTEDYPILRIRVDDSKGHSRDSFNQAIQSREYLVRRPLYSMCSTPGRGTRGYLAYDLQDRVFKFLKDSWGPSDENSLKEVDAYRILEGNNVPGILPPICGGVVEDRAGGPHSTKSQMFATITPGPNASHNDTTRDLRHSRLVQDVICSLRGLNSSEELVRVLLDIINCKTHILSR